MRSIGVPWRSPAFTLGSGRQPHEAVCDRPRTSWLLPVPLLLFAGIVALVPLAALAGRPTSVPRLVAEAFMVAGAVIAAVWAGWVLLWLLEQGG
jgi:hypothetical protein